MVALVARNGKIASIDAVGWRIKDKEPLKNTDVFWAASITKSFVAVAVMMMVDEGHLKLDDLVEKHIPGVQGAESEDREEQFGYGQASLDRSQLAQSPGRSAEEPRPGTGPRNPSRSASSKPQRIR